MIYPWLMADDFVTTKVLFHTLSGSLGRPIAALLMTEPILILWTLKIRTLQLSTRIV
tara:strand:+ start:246 stop:416 length:171 start_codon:yes stop_codon:yes gene_type:complete